MEKNVVAYLYHYLVGEARMDETFVKSLMEASCNEDLFSSAKKCDWDKKEWVVIISEEKAHAGEKDIAEAL